jgi:uncharacterized protein YggE
MRLHIIAIFLLIATVSFAQEGFKGEHFIEVTGTAQQEVDPNEITITVRLKEFEENRQKVQLEKLDQDFLNALKSAGIDKKRLELADAGSTLGKLGRKDKDAFRDKTYQLKLTSGAELEKLLEKIEPVKVDDVSIIRVYHTEMEKLRLDLKVKALQTAKTKAETLIKSINGEIGKTLMVREWDAEPVQPFDNVMIRAKSLQESPSDGDGGESTAFKKIRLRAQVTAQFEIK